MRYINIWTAPGLLGSKPRSWASNPQETATNALEGNTVPPDAGSWTLVGTLDLALSPPQFVSEQILSVQAGLGTEEYSVALMSSGPGADRQMTVLEGGMSLKEAEARFLEDAEEHGCCKPGVGSTIVLLDPIGRPVHAVS